MKYNRLTKMQQSNADCNIVSCGFLDTERCSIHNGGHCENCSVFSQIIAQLYTFENAMEEMVNGEVKERKTN